MKPNKNKKTPEIKIATLEQLSKELNKFKSNVSKNQSDILDIVENIHFKLRKDIPFVFVNPDKKELFKTFNLNILPRTGESINLKPTPGSCCLNSYLMSEFDLTEEILTDCVMNQTHFSFVVKEVTTNITIFESHPNNEFEDLNGTNFDGDYDMMYFVTLIPNHTVKKEVLIEKIKFIQDEK